MHYFNNTTSNMIQYECHRHIYNGRINGGDFLSLGLGNVAAGRISGMAVLKG